VRQETTSPKMARPGSRNWNSWTYDQTTGKLIDYSRGSGDAIQNHELNFKRDQQGRLTSYEYREGAGDELSSRTEFRYSADGKTIESTLYDAAGEVTLSTIQDVDNRGHVISVVIRERDWKTKKPKPPLKVAFLYDAKGRLLEQNTDPHKFEASGSEHELPPGKISVTYDDGKRTKTTSYLSSEGLLFSTVTYNAGGATVALVVGTDGANSELKLECTYDSYGNWTTCQQFGKRSGFNMPEKAWRRSAASLQATCDVPHFGQNFIPRPRIFPHL
jgi:hypothetical protein